MNAEPLPPALTAPPDRRPRGHAPSIGPTLRRAGRRTAAILGTLAWTLVRALFWPRDPGIAQLDDRQLADIGLTRADVARPGADRASEGVVEQLQHHGRWRV